MDTTLTPAHIDLYTGKGLWPSRLITDYLDEAAAATPDKVAAIDPRGRTTYGELKRLAGRAALGLLELGIGPGDVVSYQLPNWTEFLILHYAVTRIGAVNNPLIPIYRDRELSFMVRLAKSKLIVVPQEFRGYHYPAMVERLRGDWPQLEHVLVVDGPGTGTQTSWQEFIATPWEQRRDPAGLAALRPDPNDVTLLIFTSGTTGEPKGVLHTHNTLVAANAPLPERLGAGAGSVIHMASTFAHLTGFLYGVRLPAQAGGATAVYQDVWDPARFIELVEQHRITYTSAATPFLYDTLAAPALADHDLSSLQRLPPDWPRPLVVVTCGSSGSSAARGSSAAGAETSSPASSSTGTALMTTILGTKVLTNSRGFTVYWFAPDTSTTSKCTGFLRDLLAAGAGSGNGRGRGHRHAGHDHPAGRHHTGHPRRISAVYLRRGHRPRAGQG
jgi:acyl-CoA synthetase (AMP-forming)/AMP-acid ligase II